MKKEIYNTLSFITILSSLLLFFVFILVGCKDEVTPSLWEEKPKGETPVITSVSPPTEALAGVTIITIEGQNFSTVAENNYVYFDSKRAAILENSGTRLVVRAPDLVRDGILIKIAVFGVELFSNTMPYNLKAAVSLAYPFKDFENPYAIDLDNSGNLYMSLVADNVAKGIWKLAPDGSFTEFAPKGGETFYNGIKVGPEGKLYGVRNVRAIFEIAEGVAPVAIPVPLTTAKFLDLDFDKDKNLWVGGEGGYIFRINVTTKETKDFAFDYKISSMKVYDDHLYVAAQSNTEMGVWKMQIISADELGTPVKVFDFAANFNIITDKINTLAISADGELFLGTNTVEVMLIIYPDGSFSQWYEGLLTGPVISSSWGGDTNLYYTRAKTAEGQTQVIYKVNMEKLGAPYFGRQ